MTAIHMNPHLTPPPDPKSLIARDRALLYTRGMDIPPEDGVALALEGMRRAGPGAGAEKVMEELFGILRERNTFPIITERQNSFLVSAPPINRRTVLPRNVEPLSFTAALSRWLKNLHGRLAGWGFTQRKP